MFFQNVFVSEFTDRQFGQNFKLSGNNGRGQDLVMNWTNAPYDLTGNDGDGNASKYLSLTFAYDVDYKNWITIKIDISAGAVSNTAVTTWEIVAALNADSNFSSWFTANLQSNASLAKVMIRQKMGAERFKFYVNNLGAETLLRFNARSGVNQIFSYYDRHTMANARNFNDSQNLLIALDLSSVVDQNVINNASDYNGKSLGYNYSDALEDWQLFGGSYSNTTPFLFQKLTIDDSNRITQIIEYPSGAKIGDFAKKTNYTFTDMNTNPDQITQVPYILVSDDLITP